MDLKELIKKIKENDFVEFHINRADFCKTKNHFWLVGYNKDEIGTPLIDVNEDLKFFIEMAKKEVFDDVEKKMDKRFRFYTIEDKDFKEVKQRHLSTSQSEGTELSSSGSKSSPNSKTIRK